MATVAIVFHSGFGHTAVQAEAVGRGARSVAGTQVRMIPVEEIDQYWQSLDDADAIIMGAPTYMGSVSAGMKRFMEGTVERYFEQRWRGKLAAGFSNSASQSGDKLNTLVDIALFAAQHGMLWVNLGLVAGNDSSTGSADELNRLGGWLGAMAQSNADQGPDVAPPGADRRTAEHLGRRVAEAALRWVNGGREAQQAAGRDR